MVLHLIHLHISFRLLNSFSCPTSDDFLSVNIVRIGVLVTTLQMENFHRRGVLVEFIVGASRDSGRVRNCIYFF
jgi:hypothetical protein